ncbi:MAG TPA: hypothetical protein DIW30_01350 [Bacteroidales bacterium]|nr:hypothetical protein [Bacteroidales bacterium]
MKLLNQLRTRYNRLLESTIRLCMLTAVTFTVTACYGTPPTDFYNDPEWRKDQDTLEHTIQQMGKRVISQQDEEQIVNESPQG